MQLKSKAKNTADKSKRTWDLFVLKLACSFSLTFDVIIPIPRQYTDFEQLDWLENCFYTSINSMSSSVHRPPAPKMCNNVDKSKLLNYKEFIIIIIVGFIDV